MSFHLLAIDLDGTLLTSAKEISEQTSAILREARSQTGLRIVLATARPPRSVMPFYQLLDLDAPMINYNGALVYEPPSQRVLLHRPLTGRISVNAAVLARRMYPDVVLSGERLDKWYTDRIDPAYETETARLFEPDLVAPLERWLPRGVTKLLMHGEAPRLVEIAEALLAEYPYQLSVVQTEATLLQVMHATVSKVQALRVVCGELGVGASEVMAIGDNANDVGMLQWAGVGVAMGNATRQAKAAADYVTDHHDAEGVGRAVRRLILEGGPPDRTSRQG